LIAVVVPAYNEEEHIDRCLSALTVAARCPRLHGEEVRIWVVADSCSDATVLRSALFDATVIQVHARNVGRARAAGAREALDAGARWLAFTDADSAVAPDWISQQLGLASDVVCGTVTVDDWTGHDDAVRDHHLAAYCQRDGHRHVHGANLGVDAESYRLVGGFKALTSHEDVALVDALRVAGRRIAWSAAPKVRTSARRNFRAPEGFGATLLQASLALRVPKVST
jgi:glycosyltransferase involved in cell wall biosynthesis